MSSRLKLHILGICIYTTFSAIVYCCIISQQQEHSVSIFVTVYSHNVQRHSELLLINNSHNHQSYTIYNCCFTHLVSISKPLFQTIITNSNNTETAASSKYELIKLPHQQQRAYQFPARYDSQSPLRKQRALYRTQITEYETPICKFWLSVS